jgi:hypothetical protein
MQNLRQFGIAQPEVIQEWNEAVERIINAVGRRFLQLYLKDEIVEVAQVATSDNVAVLTETLLSICNDYSKDHHTQVEMRRMPKVQIRLTKGDGNQSTYMAKVRGNCPHPLAFIINFLKYSIPHACIDKAIDQHYMAFEDVQMNQIISSTVMNERFCPSII